MKILAMILAVVFLMGQSWVTITPVTQGTMSQFDDEYDGNYNEQHPGTLMNHAVKFREALVMEDISGYKRTGSFTGSGVVIGVSGKSSLILTVYHVCKSREPGDILGGKYRVLTSKKTIITKDLRELPVTKIAYKDPSNDICVVVVDGVAGVPAAPAAFLPEPGDRVFSVGAPKGIWDKDVVHLIEGRFIGIKTENVQSRFKRFAQYSLHAAPGASGSAIFHNGKIVGLISHGSTSYGNVAWGPSVAQVRKASEEGYKVWRADLK